MVSSTTGGDNVIAKKGKKSNEDDELTAQDKVLLVLGTFGNLEGEAHYLAEIEEACKLPKNATHRALKSGVKMNIFEKVGHGQYRLGAVMAMLAMNTMAFTPDERAVDAALKSLNRETSGLTSFYAAAGNSRFCMAYVPSEQHKMQRDWLDMVHLSRSLRTCASGRVILAHLSPFIRAKVIAEPIPDGAGPGTLDDAALAASLEEVRSLGYAIGREEGVEGWDSIAAPVMRGTQICGAALLRLPKTAMPQDLTAMIGHTVKTASLLSSICAQA
ncbi:IclR family transcriptional regulator C-terminal domain-containing protein [Streptomyces sp. NPDC020799]|uniref:IclR family transcriptional regulator domain-containing protein n=1 Tax=Streptomyces sp. NPDC020799 TaxID=3365091 RepID=UPI00349B32F5